MCSTFNNHIWLTKSYLAEYNKLRTRYLLRGAPWAGLNDVKCHYKRQISRTKHHTLKESSVAGLHTFRSGTVAGCYWHIIQNWQNGSKLCKMNVIYLAVTDNFWFISGMTISQRLVRQWCVLRQIMMEAWCYPYNEAGTVTYITASMNRRWSCFTCLLAYPSLSRSCVKQTGSCIH